MPESAASTNVLYSKENLNLYNKILLALENISLYTRFLNINITQIIVRNDVIDFFGIWILNNN
jgi:hypothetical protein